MQCARAWRGLSPLLRAAQRTPTRSYTAAARMDLSGIYPPIATPFTATEDVDYQRLEANLKKYAEIPFKGQDRKHGRAAGSDPQKFRTKTVRVQLVHSEIIRTQVPGSKSVMFCRTRT